MENFLSADSVINVNAQWGFLIKEKKVQKKTEKKFKRDFLYI